MIVPYLAQLEADGFCLLAQVFSYHQCEQILQQWATIQDQSDSAAILRTESGAVYGARNLIQLWPNVIDLIRKSALASFLQQLFSKKYGLVRVLFFDKPPDHSWALPWHKDTRIAVERMDLPSLQFTKPGMRYGVPHVDAPIWLLERMLTIRLHLDEVTDENGPLKVIPGSHRTGLDKNIEEETIQTIYAQAGDCLLMRPLLMHCSFHSLPQTKRHRRILHMELADVPDLPDGFRWHDFVLGERT